MVAFFVVIASVVVGRGRGRGASAASNAAGETAAVQTHHRTVSREMH